MPDIAYQAPKPKKPWKYWVKKIAVRIIFLPILLWDAMKLGMSYRFGVSIGKLVLPSQSEKMYPKQKFKHELSAIIRRRLPHRYPYSLIDRVTVSTHDGAILDGVQISPVKKSDEYIIYFLGNATALEAKLILEANDMEQDYEKLAANIISFNYRNVCNSTGIVKSENDLITDGIAQVQRLLDMKVPPGKIYLKGTSLGGAVSALVAAHFHDLGIEVKCFNRTSFSNITNVLTGMVRLETGPDHHPLTGYTETTKRKILATIFKPFIKLALLLCEWDMNAGKAFARLPLQNREYMLIRSSRKRRESIQPCDDSVIPHYASIHVALKKERTKQKAFLDKRIDELEKHPVSPIGLEEKKQAITSLKKLRYEMKLRKMSTQDPYADSHNSIMEDQVDRCYGQSSNDFFWQFFRQSNMTPPNPIASLVESRQRRGIMPIS